LRLDGEVDRLARTGQLEAFLMSLLRGLVGVATLGLILTGCSSATAPSSVAGTWTGTLEDVGAGPATLQFILSQSGSSLTGTWVVKFPQATSAVTGTFAGTLSGSSITAVLTLDSGAGCPENVAATVSGSTMTGTYTIPCAPSEGGTFTLKEQ
jgi:hypothetical protein